MDLISSPNAKIGIAVGIATVFGCFVVKYCRRFINSGSKNVRNSNSESEVCVCLLS